ncbi:hypothetical protein FACS1894211_13240 [Clostridia bacterium]|nr:hypothetical protein FACS1894211_13240 [Clostridia bacterium]
MTEVQYAELLRLAERNEFCLDEDEIKVRFDIEQHPDHLERLIERKDYSLSVARAFAQGFACENLDGEIERIFTSGTRYGIPAHYLILAEDLEDSNEIGNFLLTVLKENGRILKGTVCVFEYVSDDRFRVNDLTRIYKKNECGVVVVKTDFYEVGGGDYKKIQSICHCIKQNKKNVLTVLCLPKNDEKQVKAYRENLEETAFVEIRKKTVFDGEAESYLAYLAAKDGADIRGLFDRIERGKGYAKADLNGIYATFYSDDQRNTVFPQYKDLTVCGKKKDGGPAGTAYGALMDMVGLNAVKRQIRHFIDLEKTQKRMREKGLGTDRICRHMMFTGAPGTAKTTAARLLAQILRDNGVSASGKFVECGRADLVGKYVGSTAPQVRDKFKEAKGGVLFIDEAYSLSDGRDGSYGDEAIHAIVQEMENNREDTIVIFAGYKREMTAFLERNSGLKSRVAHYLDFPDYDENELMQILELLAADQKLKIDGDRRKIAAVFRAAVKTENFGNGRFVRNLLDKARLNHTGRIAAIRSVGRGFERFNGGGFCCGRRRFFLGRTA